MTDLNKLYIIMSMDRCRRGTLIPLRPIPRLPIDKTCPGRSIILAGALTFPEAREVLA